MPIQAPLVSVCIPTYCGAKYLPMAIDSVLEQSLGDFELIVIDNASPDNTADVVARYRDPRIRYLRNSSNLGAERNWNRCLEEARGRYFKLLPTDDLIFPDTLERQVGILEDDKAGRLALVFGARNIIDSAGRSIAKRSLTRKKEGVISGGDLVRRCISSGTNLIGEPGGVLFRKQLADQIGKFDATIPYVVDLDYWVRLLAYGDAYYLDKPVSAFRVSGGSWSVSVGARQSKEYQEFIDKVGKQAVWQIGVCDRSFGYLMARLNNLLRLAFYKVLSVRK